MIDLAIAFYAGGGVCAVLGTIGAARRFDRPISVMALVAALFTWPLIVTRGPK